MISSFPRKIKALFLKMSQNRFGYIELRKMALSSHIGGNSPCFSANTVQFAIADPGILELLQCSATALLALLRYLLALLHCLHCCTVGQTSVCGGLQPASRKRYKTRGRRTEVRGRLKSAPPTARPKFRKTNALAKSRIPVESMTCNWNSGASV